MTFYANIVKELINSNILMVTQIEIADSFT